MKNTLLKISLLVALVLSLVMCFVACGGDSSSTPSTDAGTNESSAVTNPSTQDSGTTSSTQDPTPAGKVVVTFDLQGGEIVFGEVSVEIDKGAKLSVISMPDVAKSGTTFKHWAYDPSGNFAWSSEDTFPVNTVLYAIWDGEGSGNDQPGTTNSSNNPGTSDSSTNPGTSDSSNNPGTTESSGGSTNPDDAKITVTFDVSRANSGTVAPETIYLTGPSKITKPATDPERKGNTFYGWCVNGDKNKVWDFENDEVTESIKLVAVFTASGSTSTCDHNWEVVEYVAPTCKANGKRTEKCSICRAQQRITYTTDPTLAKLEHVELQETVEPTCAVDGYTYIYCPYGCGLEDTIVLKATGDHQYSMLGWYTAVQPTKYVNGRLENACTVCGGAKQTRVAPLNALDEELALPDISFLYTGGEYTNEKFVNVATYGSVQVSSYFTTAMGHLINDGDGLTFWNADTYVDGAKYTDDWFTITFMENYDIGALRFVLPDYTSWELGEGCYVSYDVEYWDTVNEEWVYLGEVSDKDASSIGINCEVLMTLSEPINTNKIRAKVTHASRYAPAAVYELEVYAKTDATIRTTKPIHTEATVSISGKYNEWVTGGSAIVDNSTGTYWTTDGRYNPTPWAVLEYPVEKYIACVQIALGSHQNRTFKLEVYENGEWVTVGDKYTVPAPGVVEGNVISNADGICIFNIDIEKTVTKIRFTITREPVYWESYVYDITPYTVVENADGELATLECTHKNPRKGDTVAATCDTPGYTIMNCNCGLQIKTGATDVLGHDFGKYTIDTPATATMIGTKVASCRNDGCTATSSITYVENYDAPVVTPYLHNAPAAWAQTFDDGNYLDTYVWANEHLSKYGAKATVMMSITYSDALVSTWQEHFEKGVFDLGSHSYNHTAVYASAVSESNLLDEVVKAQYWFRHNFAGQRLLGFAAPLGTTSEAVAEYLTGPLAANRNGGDTGIFFNTIDQLTSRKIWGDLNSYISKADQTEGDYVFVNVKSPSGAYVKGTSDAEDAVIAFNGDVSYVYNEGYENMNINLVFDGNEMTFVNMGYGAGTYYYVAEDYRYDFYSSGSYNLVDGKFVFVNDNSGEYKLVKATLGSYEKGVEELVSVGGFTVECLHSLGFTNVIYSSYESTISKLEHLTRFGVWAASYNDLIRYFKEAEAAKIDVLERTDSSITLSVTDNLDNYMFDHAITIKVDIPDSWTSVTAMQNGVNIPLVDVDVYRKTKNMTQISCAIKEGYLYIDVIPDGGNVVITVGDKDSGVADYEEKVTVSFEPGEGRLESEEYEARALVGGTINSLPTPERYGYKFLGWYKDAECTEAALVTDTYSESTTLYAGWEELPKCTDGSYEHDWGSWLPASADTEQRTCKDCKITEERTVE